jgi:hypothetical protein
MESSPEALQPIPEDTGEGRWMSYDQISQTRGINRESAVKLVQREKWRRTMGNDGSARALVPLDWLKPARNASGRSAEDSQDDTGEFSRALETVETALSALREQVEAERRRADRAEQARTLKVFEAGLAALREQADAERRQAEQARDSLQAELLAEKKERARAEANVQAASERAQGEAMAAFWSRGFLARVLTALTGGRILDQKGLQAPQRTLRCRHRARSGDKPAYSGPEKDREGVSMPGHQNRRL